MVRGVLAAFCEYKVHYSILLKIEFMKKVLVDTAFFITYIVQQNSRLLATRALMKIRLSENSKSAVISYSAITGSHKDIVSTVMQGCHQSVNWA